MKNYKTVISSCFCIQLLWALMPVNQKMQARQLVQMQQPKPMLLPVNMMNTTILFQADSVDRLSAYGLPSGRLLRVIPVFSVDPEKGWGYSEETKPMLNTSHGFVPWDDLHHVQISKTNGEYDGKWVFGNANNTPRVARIDLKTFRTAEIIELPNSGGNHSSPFITENTEYLVAGTRFSIPPDDKNGDVPISSYKAKF